MGAGKKAPSKRNMNNKPCSARNLVKKDLAGVIFGCTHTTYKECVDKQLFGLPAAHFQYVQNVTQGMPLFLFNYSDRKLHGIFEAISAGQWEINPSAWKSDERESTPYPAQVRVKIQMLCQPLAEDQYQSILAKNYCAHQANYFWFELDKSQTHQLIALFSTYPVTRRVTPKWGALFSQSFAAATHQACGSGVARTESCSGTSEHTDKGKKKLKALQDDDTSFQVKSWSSLFEPQSNSLTNNKKDVKKPEPPITCQNQYNMLSESSCSELCSDDENELSGELMNKGTSPEVCDQVPILIPDSEFSGLTNTIDTVTLKQNLDEIDVTAGLVGEQNTKTVASDDSLSVEPCNEGSNISVMSVVDQDDTAQDPAVTCDEANAISTRFCNELISEINTIDLQTVVTKLIKTIGEMKISQLHQAQKIQALEHELMKSNRKMEELSYNQKTCGHSTSLSIEHVKQTQFERYFQDSSSSILLVGGFDGSSLLPDLDSYLPAKDVMHSLKPMPSVRSYASAVILNGELYVLGGGYGTNWYDTVESYNLKSHKWVECPSLNREKGSLAGANLSDKIFAIGGGNATDSFCEVEMLDLNIGKWIYSTPMTQKRFALAAAEMNGVLYAVGGYDGREYLQSAERFDPRECAWTNLRSMPTRRGCHSLAVLNEKLYAIGGFDGSTMVSTVEVYEPRVGTWIMCEPMNNARAYMGAVTFENSILAIGGMKEDGNILESVETYFENKGWSQTDFKAIGTRCFFSAVVP